MILRECCGRIWNIVLVVASLSCAVLCYEVTGHVYLHNSITILFYSLNSRYLRQQSDTYVHIIGIVGWSFRGYDDDDDIILILMIFFYRPWGFLY